MGLLASTLGEALALRPVMEDIVDLNDSAATAAENIAAAYEKGSRAVAPAPGPTLYGPTGAPVSGPARGGGGASGSARGGGAGGGTGGRGGAVGYFDEFGRYIPFDALPLDATGLPIVDFSDVPRLSGRSSGGGGGGGGPRRLGLGADQLGNRPGYRPGFAAGGSGSSAPVQTNAGGKAAVTRGEAVIADELRGLRQDIRNLSRNDNGAQLRRQGLL